jgi:LysM repeat protein
VRFLAPIALVATVAATYFVVHDSLRSKHSSTPSHRVVLPTTHAAHSKKPVRQSNVYVVKSGDSLSAISAKSGVPVATLESLNPRVDPNALQAGQRLTLRK